MLAVIAHYRTRAHFQDNIEQTVAPLLLERTWTTLSILTPHEPNQPEGN